MPGLKASPSIIDTLSSEVKTEVIYNAKKVVSEVQIRELAEVIDLLANHVFTNDQQRFYIIIDRLDEKWVEDKLRYKLIRALIETIKTFRKIRPLKITISLRIDLLNRVLEHSKDAGFQLEKYESLFLELIWTEAQLKTLLDSRINHLLKHAYTNKCVGFDDIFPRKIEGYNTIEYILKRTLMRPRDAIMFVNECLKEAQGKTEISASTIKTAEKEYSNKRLRSLQDEWLIEHPSLCKDIQLIRNGKPSFKVGEIPENSIDDLLCDLTSENPETEDVAIKAAYDVLNKNLSRDHFLKTVLYILYKIGVIGIKTDGPSAAYWIQNKDMSLSAPAIQRTSVIYIHRMLWRALYSKPK